MSSSVRLTARPFATQDFKIELIFCMKLNGHKTRKVTSPIFENKYRRVNSKSPKNELLLGFDKNLIHSMYVFAWIWKYHWHSNFLQTLHSREKSGPWVMVQKPRKFSSLVLEFWPQSFLCQSDCLILILLHEIFSDLFDLLTSFLPQQFSMMTETNWIDFGHWWVFRFLAGVP